MSTSDQLSHMIIGCAMKVHSELGHGFLESVYENALAHELRKTNLQVELQVPIKVLYDGVVVGDFIADMIVNGEIIIELKAIQSLGTIHEVQLVNYLAATRKETGLLLNFGTRSLQVKRKFRLPKEHNAGGSFHGLVGFVMLTFGKLLGHF